MLTVYIAEQCRQLEFRATSHFHGKRLMNHVIQAVDVTGEDFCRALCYMEPSCVSYNFMRRVDAQKHRCELNNFTHDGHEDDLKEYLRYLYHGAKATIEGKEM